MSARETGDALRPGRLYLVRHGQTSSNVAGALDTALPGAELTELGHEQARTVGAWLAAHGVDVEVVLSSQAQRARQTAGHVAAALGRPAEAVAGVHEVQAGDLEMRADSDSVLAYHQVLHGWLDGGDDSARLPGGEDAADVRARALPVVEELRRTRLDAGEDAVLVVHGTLMRLLAVFLGAVEPGWALVNRMPNCGVLELEHTGEAWVCHRWGDLEAPFEQH